jgi:eukaryotic-like serine/threonine-protein kinase
MQPKRACARCGVSLAPDAPRGLCGQCLLLLGLDDPAAEGLIRDKTESGERAQFESGVDPVAEPRPVGQAATSGPVDSIGVLRYFGDYELLEEIARGGMGVVYKARQVSLNRIVAVKMILGGHLAREELLRRFHQEAQAAANLQHPNIVAIHEVGEHAGQQYFSMDYVEGRNLAEWVANLGGETVDSRRAARWLKTIAEAVQYAHGQGTIHRDLKPSNILIARNDQPRITDFGLAKSLKRESGLTVSGQVVGTPSYLSPEQASGKRVSVGTAADVYGLGALLYFLLTGRAPFTGETIETTLNQVLNQDPVSPRWLNPSVRRDLETICLKCLEKEPRRRYASAQAMADELARFLEGRPILARPVGTVGKGWRWCRRRPVYAGFVAALCAVSTAGALGILSQWQRARENAHQEAEQRRLAERRGYTTSILLAQSLIEQGDFARAGEILAAHNTRLDRNWEWGWLQRACQQDLMTLTGHKGPVTQLAYSPDGQWLATPSYDQSILLWDLASGRACQTFEGHEGVVMRVVFSPDGQRAASASWDGTARVWEVSSGRELLKLVHAYPWVYGVAFHPGGHLIATGCSDGLVRLWDAQTGAQRDEQIAYGDTVFALDFSPDGRWLAYAGGNSSPWDTSVDSAVRLWDWQSGESRLLGRHQATVPTLAFSPDGKRLASGSWDGTVKVWNPETGEATLVLPRVEQETVFAVAFGPDSRQLAVVGGGVRGMARIYDVSVGRLTRELKGHSKMLRAVAFSPDGQRVATGSFDGTAKVWTTEPVPEYMDLRGHDQAVWCLAFSPGGRLIASGGLDQTARVWDIREGSPVAVLPVGIAVLSLAWNPTGTQLLTPAADGSAVIWDVTVGKETWRLPSGGHTLLAVGWSPDDRWLATGGKDRTVTVWDATARRVYQVLEGHTDWIFDLAFSPDGRHLATASGDATVRLWDFQAGDCLRRFAGQTARVLCVAFSGDGRLLATGADDRVARLYDVRTGDLLQRLEGHRNGVGSVAFSPDNRRLVTTGSGAFVYNAMAPEDRVFIWDVSTGQQVLSFRAHPNIVLTAAFAPDGRCLATGGVANVVRLWTAFPWLSEELETPAADFGDPWEAHKRRYWKEELMRAQARHERANPGRRWVEPTVPGFLFDRADPPLLKGNPAFPVPFRPNDVEERLLDLAAVYNATLNERWLPISSPLDEVDDHLAALGTGVQTLAGVRFDVRSLIQLKSRWRLMAGFPEQASINVGRRFQAFHVLHGATGYQADGTVIGHYLLDYTDGHREELPILYGRHLRDWGDRGECAESHLAWETTDTGPSAAGPRHRLYRTSYRNPRPQSEVQRITFASALTHCAPFLIAITLEP